MRDTSKMLGRIIRPYLVKLRQCHIIHKCISIPAMHRPFRQSVYSVWQGFYETNSPALYTSQYVEKTEELSEYNYLFHVKNSSHDLANSFKR